MSEGDRAVLVVQAVLYSLVALWFAWPRGHVVELAAVSEHPVECSYVNGTPRVATYLEGEIREHFYYEVVCSASEMTTTYTVDMTSRTVPHD